MIQVFSQNSQKKLLPEKTKTKTIVYDKNQDQYPKKYNYWDQYQDKDQKAERTNKPVATSLPRKGCGEWCGQVPDWPAHLVFNKIVVKFPKSPQVLLLIIKNWALITKWSEAVDIDMYNRVCHLQFFLISLLFQAGIYPRHTKEQEKYRSYMVYVYIFQRFLTFVLYKLHITITREKWPK